MIEMIEEFVNGLSSEERVNFITNLNRMQLNRKPYIKKYNKIRKAHSEIIDSMQDYIFKGKYDTSFYTDEIVSELALELKGKNIELNTSNANDLTIFLDLYCYKNHKNLPSVTEIYLEKNKFKNPDKIKILNSMNNSFTGLFKVVSADRENGYAYLEDVFTHKRYKIIDISLSSTFNNKRNIDIYVYNRIITVDDISFMTGIHCMMTSKNNKLKRFIKKHNYKKCSDYSRCLLLYEISKTETDIKPVYNNHYGYR